LGETHIPFNVVPRPAAAQAPQMAGWFRRKINTVSDYKGLKTRIGTNLGGKVGARAGGTVVLTPAAEIYAALERGVIDACECAAPYDDMKLGLHKAARYYYPGWHEPGTVSLGWQSNDTRSPSSIARSKSSSKSVRLPLRACGPCCPGRRRSSAGQSGRQSLKR